MQLGLYLRGSRESLVRRTVSEDSGQLLALPIERGDGGRSHSSRVRARAELVKADVAVQSFLLIVRTRHVVTIVNVRSDVTMSSAGFSEFPAYGRIYRQQGLLSHDVLNPARVPL